MPEEEIQDLTEWSADNALTMCLRHRILHSSSHHFGRLNTFGVYFVMAFVGLFHFGIAIKLLLF